MAHEVRAHTVYANSIDADEVRGMIYHSPGLQVANVQGNLTAPDVAASVVYADSITANVINASTVYVRDRELSRIRKGTWYAAQSP
jgi:hypothetical protein